MTWVQFVQLLIILLLDVVLFFCHLLLLLRVPMDAPLEVKRRTAVLVIGGAALNIMLFNVIIFQLIYK